MSKGMHINVSLDKMPKAIMELLKGKTGKAQLEFTGISLTQDNLEVTCKDPVFGKEVTFSYAVKFRETGVDLVDLKASMMMKPFIKMGLGKVFGEPIKREHFSLVYDPDTCDIKMEY